MKFTGTLVRPLADQGDRDGLLIDPAGVKFTEGMRYPVTIEFDYQNAVGYATVSRAPDGSIVADCEIVYAEPEHIKGLRLAAGVALEAEDVFPAVSGRPRRVAARSRLNAIGLTPNHSDPGQPAITVTEERE